MLKDLWEMSTAESQLASVCLGWRILTSPYPVAIGDINGGVLAEYCVEGGVLYLGVWGIFEVEFPVAETPTGSLIIMGSVAFLPSARSARPLKTPPLSKPIIDH